MDHEPNGASLQSVLHYAQTLLEDRFQFWAPDYITWFNIGANQQTDLIPLNLINKKTPIAFIVGRDDKIANPFDAAFTKEQIGEAVIHYQMIEGGHLSFLIGKDMNYFKEDVMNMLRTYHPI